jgi:transposase
MSPNQFFTAPNNLSRPLGQYLTPFQRKLLEKSLQENLPELYRQRVEIMLLADRGKSQAEICQLLGCSQATANRWILVAQSGMAHEWQKRRRGRPQKVNEQYLERLKELVSHSPRDFGYAFERWTGHWLSKQLEKEFGLKLSGQHINRLLKHIFPHSNNLFQKEINIPSNSRLIIRDLPLPNSVNSPGSLFIGGSLD